jgi:hypothetical protein
MGLCWGAPEAADGSPSSSPSASPVAAAAAAAPAAQWHVAGEVHVQERQEYDTDMRHHLVSHSTPRKVELTITAAAVFAARARLAHDVVAKRKAESGCESSVALLRSPSAKDHHEEALRSQMSREEKIADGLKLLRQRVDNVGVKVIHMEDDGNCQFRSLAQGESSALLRLPRPAARAYHATNSQLSHPHALGAVRRAVRRSGVA